MNDNGNVKTVSRITNRSAANTVITNDNFYFLDGVRRSRRKRKRASFLTGTFVFIFSYIVYLSPN